MICGSECYTFGCSNFAEFYVAVDDLAESACLTTTHHYRLAVVDAATQRYQQEGNHEDANSGVGFRKGCGHIVSLLNSLGKDDFVCGDFLPPTMARF